MKKVNLEGMSFGFLMVLRESQVKIYEKGNTVRQWLCKCICGNEVTTSSALLLRKNILRYLVGVKILHKNMLIQN